MHTKDEFFHAPGTAERWNESHYLDIVDRDNDVYLYTRIGFHPNQDLANLWAYVVANDRIYWDRWDEISLDNVHGLVIREDDFRFEMLPTSTMGEWSLAFEGPLLSAPADAYEDILADEGPRTDVSFDFTTTARHEPFLYSRGGWDEPDDSDRFELATTNAGTVTVDGQQHDVSGPGERDHSWGPRNWFYESLNHLWASASFADGTAFNVMLTNANDAEPTVFNGFWFDGDETTALSRVRVTGDPPLGAETTDAWRHGDPPILTLELEWTEGSTEVEIEPLVHAPVFTGRGDFELAFPRSAARHSTTDGQSGVGWIENTCPL